jgi:hypothetical protein
LVCSLEDVSGESGEILEGGCSKLHGRARDFGEEQKKGCATVCDSA